MNLTKGEGIMTALNFKEDKVIVIDSDRDKAEEIKKMLEKSMEKVALINIKCLFDRFQEINELMKNHTYRKMFYGASEESFNKIIRKFDSKDDSIYIGFDLKIKKVAIDYWKYRGFINLPPAFKGQKI